MHVLYPKFRTTDDVSAWAGDNLGVTLALFDYGEDIFVSHLRRQEKSPKGSGARAMAGLTHFADNIGKPLTLVVISGEPRLIAYYSRFGFHPVGSSARHGENVRMRRDPQSAEIYSQTQEFFDVRRSLGSDLGSSA